MFCNQKIFFLNSVSLQICLPNSSNYTLSDIILSTLIFEDHYYWEVSGSFLATPLSLVSAYFVLWLACRGYYCYSARLSRYTSVSEKKLCGVIRLSGSFCFISRSEWLKGPWKFLCDTSRQVFSRKHRRYTYYPKLHRPWMDWPLSSHVPSSIRLSKGNQGPPSTRHDYRSLRFSSRVYLPARSAMDESPSQFPLCAFRHLHNRYNKRRPQSSHSNRILFPWCHNNMTSHYAQVQNLVNMQRERKYFIQELCMQTW